MQGTRVEPEAIARPETPAGAYAGPIPRAFEPWNEGATYYVKCPDGGVCALRSPTHRVEEHDDGTISAMPSIIHPTTRWHGFLQRGAWSGS